MEFYLPNEVLFQIVIRLPVRSLLRFRCVSRFWNSRISKLNFISSHYHFAGNHNLLFRNYYLDIDREFYSLHSDNHEFQQIETLNFPFRAASQYFKIIGCVNGLVCLWDDDAHETTLWNPAIKKYYNLPNFEMKPPINLSRKLQLKWKPTVIRDLCFGFGYDTSSNDFKVVRLFFYSSPNGQGFETAVSVFSLGRKSWRTVDCTTVDCSTPLQRYTRPCNVGRFVYRMTRRFEIVGFDLSAEVFTQIVCPDEVQPVVQCNAELINFRDSLAMLHEWDTKRYHIWVMRDDGVAKPWMKVFSVDLDPCVPRQRILGFTKTGKLVVVGDGNVLVSPVVEDVQVLNYVPPSLGEVRSWHMEPFKESLFLLKEGLNLPFA